MTHDPGGRSSRALPAGVIGSALFSGPDDCYRLELWRRVKGAGEDAPFVMFVGMNPSTASAEADDPTIAIEYGMIPLEYGMVPPGERYLKMNLSPYRATDPKRLAYAFVPLSPEGHTAQLVTRAMTADTVIMACGVPPGPLLATAMETFETLLWAGVDLWCLGTTKEGFPRHPLYMPAGSPLARWYGPAEGLGPTKTFYPPDGTWGRLHEGDCYAMRAPRGKRVRDLLYFQVVGHRLDYDPIAVPAAHLAYRYKADVDAWVKRVSG